MELWTKAISKISHSTSLYALEVNIDTMLACHGPFEDLAWCRLLEFLQVTPPSVSQFKLIYDGDNEEFGSSTRDMDWHRLDETLCRREKLDSVVFYFTGDIYEKRTRSFAALETFLMDNLPQTQSLGVLTFLYAL